MDMAAFTVLSPFLKASSGLMLTPDKAYLLHSRLQPVAIHHGLKSVEELASHIRTGVDQRLKTDVIEAMTTNETSFFRDITPFDNFRDHVLPQVMDHKKNSRTLRILCAAASSGQEPYSLAMVLLEQGARLAGWNTEIVGIDLDTKILRRAEDGAYTQFEVQRGLPTPFLIKYFQQLPNQTWRVKPEVRRLTKFRQANLLKPLQEFGKFDVIFCRNVLIYFDLPTKKDVLERLSAQMTDSGFLFLGGAETVVDITDAYVSLPGKRGLYCKRPVRPQYAVG